MRHGEVLGGRAEVLGGRAEVSQCGVGDFWIMDRGYDHDSVLGVADGTDGKRGNSTRSKSASVRKFVQSDQHPEASGALMIFHTCHAHHQFPVLLALKSR